MEPSETSPANAQEARGVCNPLSGKTHRTFRKRAAADWRIVGVRCSASYDLDPSFIFLSRERN